jgi:hypothetical protein
MRISTARFFGTASLACLIGFLLVGLWPFDFSPKNKAAWRPDGKGLFFDGRRVPWKRSVGSFAFLGPLNGPTRNPAAETGAFTLAIRLEPEFETTKGLDQILNVVDALGTEVISLGQWKTTLIIRWRDSAGKKWREFGVGKALLKGRPRWLTIATGGTGTDVSIDGQQAVHHSGTLTPSKSGDLREYRIVLGNSPERGGPWTGTFSALAIYEKSMSAKTFFEEWDRSSDFDEGLLAAFNLEVAEEGRGRDLSGNGNALDIPRHIKIRARILKKPDFSLRTRGSILKDLAVNILGFVPFGFFFMGMLVNTGRRWRGANLILAVFAGLLVSLLIEIVQGFIPARDSSRVDVLCNSAGALLGATGYLLFLIMGRKPSFRQTPLR